MERGQILGEKSSLKRQLARDVKDVVKMLSCEKIKGITIRRTERGKTSQEVIVFLKC